MTKYDEMCALLINVKDQLGLNAAREIIAEHGQAKKLHQVPEKCWDAVIEEANKRLQTVKGAVPLVTSDSPAEAQGVFTSPAFKHAQHDRVSHSGKEMATFYLGLPGDLNTNAIKLVVDTANLMGQKLKAAQDKYGYEDGWMNPEWAQEEVRKSAFEHLMKGDPLDVINYMAFMLYHGYSSAPQSMVEADEMVSVLHMVLAQDKQDRRLSFNIRGRVIDSREKAQAAVAELQQAWDLVDENEQLKLLMEKMEERHGDEFNAFFEATIRQVMVGSGMTEVRINTAEVLKTLVESKAVRVREVPGFLIYELAEDVPDADVH